MNAEVAGANYSRFEVKQQPAYNLDLNRSLIARLNRSLQTVVVAIVAIFWSWNTLADENRGADADQVQKLVAKWNGRSSEIVSGQLKYRIFNDDEYLKQLTPAEVRAIFEGANLSQDEDAMARLVNQIRTTPHELAKPWTECAYTFEGDRRRDESAQRLHVFDGTDDIITSPANSSVQIGQRPGPIIMSKNISDFRYTVTPNLFDRLKIGSQDQGGGLEIYVGANRESARTSFFVDEGTGDVLEMLDHNGRGEVIKQTLQADWIIIPGEIAFPMSRGVFDYRSGLLAGAKIIVISAVTLNEEVPPEVFHVAATKNLRIRDFRGAVDKDLKATAPQKSVKDYVDNIHKPSPSQQVVKSSSLGVWLLIGNMFFFACIAIGLWLWRRTS